LLYTNSIRIKIVTNIILYSKAIKTIITLTIIPNNALTIFKIVIDIIPLVLARFAIRIVIIPRNTYCKSKSKRRTILDTRIAIDFQKR
jgi:hypothetical protein